MRMQLIASAHRSYSLIQTQFNNQLLRKCCLIRLSIEKTMIIWS
jgi:hypothetical protein